MVDGFMGGLTGSSYWTLEDPFDSRSDPVCMVADWSSSSRLFESSCSSLLPFVCYNGTQQNPEYVFVNEAMSWSSAQRYCRHNFTDLVTVESAAVWKNIQDAVSPDRKSWIGLYRDSNMSWSDGRDLVFYQTPFSFLLWPDLTSARCCLQHGQTRGHWHFNPCERKFPFICHDLLKVKTHVVKLRVKTENSDVLNDAAVKLKLLEKLQEKLKENGVSGVEVKWRQTTDGKVFNREEKKKTEL
ncbi:hypothetical protein OJAV_G00178930 [Oryzias javanicus]|uniref:C-type lectin domain-containing protein n=1 Tax=Oryzias javanicus TaxID=123683 RepID=A0A3S2PG36_ORYJA|nr:hypothetical protein OJAV_G00178930 [Oryzias javanicus]